MLVQGTIIGGNFDESMNEFSLTRMKNLYTESVLSEKQMNNIYQYLLLHRDSEDGQIVTLYDQMPLRLSKEEINQLIGDLEEVMSKYH